MARRHRAIHCKHATRFEWFGHAQAHRTELSRYFAGGLEFTQCFAGFLSLAGNSVQKNTCETKKIES